MFEVAPQKSAGRVPHYYPVRKRVSALRKVEVSAMGFPWAITEHYGNTEEMLAHVDVAPHVPEGTKLPWHSSSWAPIFDAATSVGSTIFFNNPTSFSA